MAADPGASHAKRGRPSPETVDLLQSAHAALRAELADSLAELRPAATTSGPIVFGETEPAPVRPGLADRVRLVGLIGDLMKLLGTEIVAPATAPDDIPRPLRRRRPRFE